VKKKMLRRAGKNSLTGAGRLVIFRINVLDKAEA